MCRICGRVVKCIFDTMPSRTFQVPSRRAFSTFRRTPVLSRSITPIVPQLYKPQLPTLASSFSSLSLASQPRLPQPSSTISSLLVSTAIQTRSFSATAADLGPRRTYNPSRKVQKRRHGYLARAKSEGGQKILKRRSAKGRKYLTW